MKIRHHILEAFAMLFIALSTLWSVDILAQNGWERMQDMNIERLSAKSCLLENRIYVFGGQDYEYKYISTTVVYDINTNEWTSLAGLPAPTVDPHVCAVNNMIYILGGWQSFSPEGRGFEPSDANYKYNPELDDYSIKKNCPSNTCGSPSCALNNQIYIFGFRKSGGKRNKEVFRYDPVIDNWDTLPDMIFEHTNGNAVSLNNRIYLIGGAVELYRNKYESYIEVYDIEGKSEMFDPVTDSFTVLKDMPYPVASHSSVVYNNKILVFGGDTANFIYASTNYGSNIIQEYDPSTDTWRVMEGMSFYRTYSTAQKAGDFVYIIGGTDKPNHNLREVWRYDLNYLKPLLTNEPSRITIPKFTLQQNYPNPFSGSTKIDYELREPGEVKLDIVDIPGQEITTLVHEMKSPGNYSLTWNAEGVNPGVYFCRLKMGDTKKVIKLLILQ
jgi:N-acetylneuraminic acid mutarotase